MKLTGKKNIFRKIKNQIFIKILNILDLHYYDGLCGICILFDFVLFNIIYRSCSAGRNLQFGIATVGRSDSENIC